MSTGPKSAASTVRFFFCWGCFTFVLKPLHWQQQSELLNGNPECIQSAMQAANSSMLSVNIFPMFFQVYELPLAVRQCCSTGWKRLAAAEVIMQSFHVVRCLLFFWWKTQQVCPGESHRAHSDSLKRIRKGSCTSPMKEKDFSGSAACGTTESTIRASLASAISNC